MKDPVSPELRAYVIRRDGGCVVGRLLSVVALVIRPAQRPCRNDLGEVIVWNDQRYLTAAHVRDRGKGGRSAKRPPSTPRHLVAACYGHHLASPVVDLADVRDVLDAYLEEREGPDQDDGNRPHEAIARVRSARSRDAGIVAPAGSDRQEGRVDPDGS